MQDSQPAVFHNKTIAVPESRQLDVLAALLEKRGATVWRCPLVAIHDTPDQQGVTKWIKRVIESPLDLMIWLTGEGVRRAFATAEREGLKDQFQSSIAKTPCLVRGPKPAGALRQLGIEPALTAHEPTTPGVIHTLQNLQLERGLSVGVQLYGLDPNLLLRDYLTQHNMQTAFVAPYVYADDAETEQVKALILALTAGEIDAMLFTSTPQLKRLQRVADQYGLEAELQQGLQKTVIAAVGPVMANCLEEQGFKADLMPPQQFFMKPLVNALERYWG